MSSSDSDDGGPVDFFGISNAKNVATVTSTLSNADKAREQALIAAATTTTTTTASAARTTTTKTAASPSAVPVATAPWIAAHAPLSQFQRPRGGIAAGPSLSEQEAEVSAARAASAHQAALAHAQRVRHAADMKRREENERRIAATAKDKERERIEKFIEEEMKKEANGSVDAEASGKPKKSRRGGKGKKKSAAAAAGSGEAGSGPSLSSESTSGGGDGAAGGTGSGKVPSKKRTLADVEEEDKQPEDDNDESGSEDSGSGESGAKGEGESGASTSESGTPRNKISETVFHKLMAEKRAEMEKNGTLPIEKKRKGNDYWSRDDRMYLRFLRGEKTHN